MKGKLSPEERTALIEEGKRLKETIAAREKELRGAGEEAHRGGPEDPQHVPPRGPRRRGGNGQPRASHVGHGPVLQLRAEGPRAAGRVPRPDRLRDRRARGGPEVLLPEEPGGDPGAFPRCATRWTCSCGRASRRTSPPTWRARRSWPATGSTRAAPRATSTPWKAPTCASSPRPSSPSAARTRGRSSRPSSFPLLLAGVSHCFRREAGAAGQFSKGLYRVHQFTKVEMFVFCRPSESEAMHERLIGIEERIYQGLEIPYRIVDTCTGDLGRPRLQEVRHRGVDARAGERRASGGRSPAPPTARTTRRGAWASVSREEGKNAFVHTLNGTALAVSRTLIALLENFQREDGSILRSRGAGRLHGIQGDPGRGRPEGCRSRGCRPVRPGAAYFPHILPRFCCRVAW